MDKSPFRLCVKSYNDEWIEWMRINRMKNKSQSVCEMVGKGPECTRNQSNIVEMDMDNARINDIKSNKCT